MNIPTKIHTYEVLKEFLHVFSTENIEFMNNLIIYVAPKNKMVEHSMILNSSISRDVGISIFSYNKYWQAVFDLINLNISPTFKTFLQDETIYSKKNHTTNDKM